MCRTGKLSGVWSPIGKRLAILLALRTLHPFVFFVSGRSRFECRELIKKINFIIDALSEPSGFEQHVCYVSMSETCDMWNQIYPQSLGSTSCGCLGCVAALAAEQPWTALSCRAQRREKWQLGCCQTVRLIDANRHQQTFNRCNAKRCFADANRCQQILIALCLAICNLWVASFSAVAGCFSCMKPQQLSDLVWPYPQQL